ncbi:hypothetical protein SDC9_156712 [bioreactor metagenome]|uniref:Uncharacterized protein n=1 Tax=bioreactor metagenome TaxID=1076179 RepID=A0A645F7C1_9ZZZZ
MYPVVEFFLTSISDANLSAYLLSNFSPLLISSVRILAATVDIRLKYFRNRIDKLNSPDRLSFGVIFILGLYVIEVVLSLALRSDRLVLAIVELKASFSPYASRLNFAGILRLVESYSCDFSNSPPNAKNLKLFRFISNPPPLTIFPEYVYGESCIERYPKCSVSHL